MQEYFARTSQNIAKPHIPKEQFMTANSIYTKPVLPPLGIQNQQRFAFVDGKTTPVGPIVVNQYAVSSLLSNQNKMYTPQPDPRAPMPLPQFRAPYQVAPGRLQVNQNQVDPACFPVNWCFW